MKNPWLWCLKCVISILCFIIGRLSFYWFICLLKTCIFGCRGDDDFNTDTILKLCYTFTLIKWSLFYVCAIFALLYFCCCCCFTRSQKQKRMDCRTIKLKAQNYGYWCELNSLLSVPLNKSFSSRFNHLTLFTAEKVLNPTRATNDSGKYFTNIVSIPATLQGRNRRQHSKKRSGVNNYCNTQKQ